MSQEQLMEQLAAQNGQPQEKKGDLASMTKDEQQHAMMSQMLNQEALGRLMHIECFEKAEISKKSKIFNFFFETITFFTG